jgi:hypothetical protein
MNTVHRRFATAAPELPNGFAEHTLRGHARSGDAAFLDATAAMMKQ